MVGYAVRLESRRSADTRLLFCTTGVLLRRLQDPTGGLGGLTHVVVDEVHERSLDGDFLLIVLREAMRRHPQLRVVLMSATLDADRFSSYFGDCAVLRAPPKGKGPEPAPMPTHVIWAETAVPYVLGREPSLIRALAHAAPVEGALLTGALRVDRSDPDAPKVYNSLYVVEASGRIAQTYDKHHLVPFGEYVPIQKWLGFLKITQGRGNFSAGPGPRVLEVKGLPPFSPLICYEVIFPHAVVPPITGQDDGPRPRWLLNITNDAWFGISPGPYQHLAAARLRSASSRLASFEATCCRSA